MSQSTSTQKTGLNISWGRLLLLAIIVVLTSMPFFLAINYVDLGNNAIAYDWRTSFHGAIFLENFGWGLRPFQTPPWSIWFLLPFTALPFEIGWAVLMYLTMLVLVLSVPRRPSRNLWLLGTLLLLTAHPTLRNFADVNLEAFVIAGLLITLYAFHQKKPYIMAFGILLAAIKPQAIYLVFLVMGLYMLQIFHWRDIAKVVLICGGVFTITMLIWGQAWLSTLGALPVGISLTSGLSALNFPALIITLSQIIVAIISIVAALRGDKRLSRAKVGLLVAGSILAAPYANGLSVVTLLTFGGIAIFMKRPWLGVFVFILYNFPYIQAFGVDAFTARDSVYFLIILLITWGILLLDVFQETQREVTSTTKEI